MRLAITVDVSCHSDQREESPARARANTIGRRKSRAGGRFRLKGVLCGTARPRLRCACERVERSGWGIPPVGRNDTERTLGAKRLGAPGIPADER